MRAQVSVPLSYLPSKIIIETMEREKHREKERGERKKD